MPTTTAKKAPARKTTTTAKPATKATAQPAKKVTPAPKEKKTAKPAAESLIEALTTKQASLVKVRANKTQRSLPYLAQGTPERKAAEDVAARVAKGETVPAIAEDLKVPLATARRFLTNLALAQQVESGAFDGLRSPGTKQVIVHTVQAKG